MAMNSSILFFGWGGEKRIKTAIIYRSESLLARL